MYMYVPQWYSVSNLHVRICHACISIFFREGVQFALEGLDSRLSLDEVLAMDPPPNIDFLMILNEFSPRLLAVDRTGEKGVISFLESQLPNGLMEAVKEKMVEGWDSLMFYHRHTSTVSSSKGRTPGITIAVTRPVSQSRARKRPLKINGKPLWE